MFEIFLFFGGYLGWRVFSSEHLHGFNLDSKRSMAWREYMYYVYCIDWIPVLLLETC